MGVRHLLLKMIQRACPLCQPTTKLPVDLGFYILLAGAQSPALSPQAEDIRCLKH